MKILCFSSKTCGPCRRFAPIWDNLANEMDDITFERIMIDDGPGRAAAHKYAISSVPTILWVDSEEDVVLRKVGMLDEDEMVDIIQGLWG